MSSDAPSSLVLGLRGFTLVVVAAWLALSPSYRYIVKPPKSPFILDWAMFRGHGSDMCDVRFFIAAAAASGDERRAEERGADQGEQDVTRTHRGSRRCRREDDDPVAKAGRAAGKFARTNYYPPRSNFRTYLV